MNLLVLSEMFPSTISPSSGRFVAGQTVELSRLTNVNVLVPVVSPLLSRVRYSGESRSAIRLPPDIDLPPERVHYVRYTSLPWRFDYLNAYLAYAAVRRALRRYRLAPDIVHAHPGYPTGYVAYLAARHLDVPLVVTLHGFDINVFGGAGDARTYSDDPSFASRFYSPRIRGRFVRSLLHSSRVIAVSQDLSHKAVALGVPQERLSVIPNGVDTEQFRIQERTAVRRTLGLPAEDPVILFIGRMTQVKDPLCLVEAVKLLRQKRDDVRAVFLGDGELLEPVKQVVARDGLTESVQILGNRPYTELPLWMNACNVLVSTSRYESFGLVLLEALACGTPVVASRVGGIPDLVRDGEQGILVPPGDPSSLARAIAQALDRAWDRHALRRHAEAYSWGRVAGEIAHLYQKVLKEPL